MSNPIFKTTREVCSNDGRVVYCDGIGYVPISMISDELYLVAEANSMFPAAVQVMSEELIQALGGWKYVN